MITITTLALPHLFSPHHWQDGGKHTTVDTLTTSTNKEIIKITTSQVLYDYLITKMLPFKSSTAPPPQSNVPPTPQPSATNHIDSTPPKSTNITSDTTSQKHQTPMPCPQPTPTPAKTTSSGQERGKSNSMGSSTGKKIIKGIQGPRLLQYLFRLLQNPTSNPSIIKWKNEEEGVFRLIKPKVIAKLWGNRNERIDIMCKSYEDLLKILHVHCATGSLKTICEKTLLYQFNVKPYKVW